MKYHVFCMAALVMLTIMLAGPLQADAYFRIVDLGTLGGSYGRAAGIATDGTAIGESDTADPETHATVWASDGSISDLGTLTGGTYSGALGLNDSGDIVGYSEDENGNMRAFVYSGGVMSDLGTLGGSYGQAFAINNKGQIVGYTSTTDDWEEHAVIWEDGNMIDLGTLGGYTSAAYGINADGVVVGSSYDADGYRRAFIYDGDEMEELVALEGNFSVATAINNKGQIVGYGSLPSSPSTIHAFLTNASGVTDLGTLGGSVSYGQAINAYGHVVGQSLNASSIYRAFVWNGNEMLDLNTLIDPTLGWNLTSADGINQHGWIVGTGTINGETHAYRLEWMAPEPGTWALMVVGLASGVIWQWRRRKSPTSRLQG